MKPHYRARYGFGKSDYIDTFVEKRFLFDEISNLIGTADFLKQRIAYIMTDHLVEVLLNDGLERVIHEYHNNMLGPDLDGGTFKGLRMNFDAKLEFFTNELSTKVNAKNSFSLMGNFRLSQDEATILGILHRYRNDMYHREQVNRDVLDAFVRIYVTYTLDIFARFAPAGSVGGPNWKEKGVADLANGSMLSFQAAAKKLKQSINLAHATIEELVDTLAEDTNKRYLEIQQILRHDLPSHEEPKLQEFFANLVILPNDLEFELEDDKSYHRLLEKYKTAVRTMDAASLVRTKQDIEKYRDETMKTFQTDLDYADLQGIVQEILTLKGEKTLDAILNQYYQIDQKLLRYRDRVVQGSIDFDREIQRQIDISRGK